MKLGAVLFITIPLVFMGIGLWLANEQSRKLKRFVPVEATVLGAKVESRTSHSSRGGSSTTYKPVVTYRYTVDGQPYTNDDVTPIGFSSSNHDWAGSVVKRFRGHKDRDEAVQAWYNPDDPSEAFLLKERAFFPYMLILFPMLLVAVGVYLWGQASSSRVDPLEPLPAQPGWSQVRPRSLVTYKRLAATVIAASWCFVGLLALWHYTRAGGESWGLDAKISLAIYFGVATVPVGMVVYYSMLGRAIDDPIITLDVDSVRLGDTLTVQVEQYCKRAVEVQEMSVGVTCRRDSKTKHGGKTTYSSSTCYEDLIPCIAEHSASAGETLTAARQLTMPRDAHPSRTDRYPKFTWFIDVRTRLAACPDYRGKFAVEVGMPRHNAAVDPAAERLRAAQNPETRDQG